MNERVWFCLFTCSFSNGESKTNGSISKRHDSSKDWKPWKLVKIWDLAKNNLNTSKDNHERIVWCLALHVMTMLVETIWPFHSPEIYKNKYKNHGHCGIFSNTFQTFKFFYLHHTNWCCNCITNGYTKKICILS